MYKYYYTPVFVPSRGFLFFYSLYIISSHILILFSSPHGDFSFSIICSIPKPFFQMFSSPHGDFSFSMAIRWKNYTKALTVFVPSRGFLFFYITCRFRCFKFRNKFSSPHGDFSFSIKMEIHFTIATIRFSSPHGDFSFSIVKGWQFCCVCTLWFSSPHGDFSFSINKEQQEK